MTVGMRTLGLLGGMSWESTTTYYQMLNRLARERLGGGHSAKLLMWSADFAPLSEMLAEGRWADLQNILVDAARRLEAAGAEAILICSNTMHQVAEAVQDGIGVPVIHVCSATAAGALSHGSVRPVLIATRFTMERDFYREALKARGVDVVIPGPMDRARLHAIIFDELVQGRFENRSRTEVIEIVERTIEHAGADGVILGCTEFGLLVRADDFTTPVLDTTELHALAAMDFALSP